MTKEEARERVKRGGRLSCLEFLELVPCEQLRRIVQSETIDYADEWKECLDIPATNNAYVGNELHARPLDTHQDAINPFQVRDSDKLSCEDLKQVLRSRF